MSLKSKAFQLLLGSLFLLQNSFGQIDSLRNSLSANKSDTARIETLTNIGSVYFSERNVDSCLFYFEYSIQEAEKAIAKNPSDKTRITLKDQISYSYYKIAQVYDNTNHPDRALTTMLKSKNIMESEDVSEKGLARLYYDLNEIYDKIGKDDSSVYYLKKSLQLNEKLKDYPAQIAIHNNLGDNYFYGANTKAALEEYEKALQIASDQQLNESLGGTYGRLGRIFIDQGETDKALEYLWKSVKNRNGSKQTRNLSYTYQDISRIYHDHKKDNDSALYFLTKAIELQKSIDDKMGLSASFNSYGDLLIEKNLLDSALAVYQQSYIYGMEAQYLNGVCGSLAQQGFLFQQLNQPAKAYPKFKEALELLAPSKNHRQLMDVYKGIYKSSKSLGYTDEALDNIEKYYFIKDSLYNDDNKKSTLKLQMQHEYNLKTIADSISFAEAEQREKIEHDRAIDKQRSYTNYGILGCIVLLVLFIGIYRNNQQKKKSNQALVSKNEVISAQKQEVEEQKSILEERNKEIMDSIVYAKRLQNAILPPAKVVKEYLTQSFILYLPKDIVAGDFYWMETIDDNIYFAAADCTGHGVPGAMVSVVCSNALTKALVEDKIYNTGNILDRTRELVIQRFVKSEEEVKDGMDISLCKFNAKTNELEWAGANNPLWIVRADSSEIEEIKANKQPIGLYGMEEPFTSHKVQLQKGDSLYIFTDGYADQFGGERGKKYKSSKFKHFLLSINDQNMDKQRDLLFQEFESWRGSVEQIDDVCIIGVKI